MTLRDIRVRRRLHELDSTKASYPTVARTGDKNRSGKFKLVFDDTKTIIFKSSAAISYPTTLETGSPYLTRDLRSDIRISGTGSVNSSAVDPWVVRSYESEPYAAFSEDRLFEVDNFSNNFYLTGTDAGDVGLGFSSGLRSKTVIRLELPIQAQLALADTTASLYYYNPSLKTFDLFSSFVGDGSHTLDYLGFNNNTVSRSRNSGLPFENLLFNPFGKTAISSVNPKLPNLFFDSLPGAINRFNSSLSLPSGTQQIKMSSLINQPFLLEKCVVEIPFQAGPGWFSDTTMYSTFAEDALEQAFYGDSGGPAITFALLNNISNDTRDLILSGVITHASDVPKKLVLTSISTDGIVRTPGGFTTFGYPSAVVTARGSTFTGSVKMEIDPVISVGVNSVDAPAGGTLYPLTNFDRAGNSVVQLATRSKSGRGIDNFTGRSVFGRTAPVPTLDSSKIVTPSVDLYNASGSAGVDEDFIFYRTEKHQKSPYLLFPTDNLTIALSKCRSAFVSSSIADDGSGPPSRAASLYTNQSGGSTWAIMSSSHDVAIPAGVMHVTLYGSLIREGEEFNDTLNSRLDTDQIHEMIGSDPATDKFDVAYSSEFSGSIIDRYITGSIFAQGTNSVRRRVFSLSNDGNPNKNLLNGERGDPFSDSTINRILTPRREITTNFRNIQCVSPDERLWDSLVPDIVDITRTNGGTISTSSIYTSTQVVNIIDLDSATAVSDRLWTKSFPFEPRYSRIARINQDKLRFQINGPEFSYRNVDKQFVLTIMDTAAGIRRTFADGPTSNFISNNTGAYANLTFGLSLDDLFKTYFGVGDMNTMISASAGGVGFVGSTNFASFRLKARDGGQALNFLHRPLIRGWKYGLASGLPLFTKTIFKRDSYGCMRDMLEQRIDTKFSIQGSSINSIDSVVKVRFVNASGDSVLPEETFSSNLSLEVTSSLPYFDGVVRNREEPMTFAKTNQSLVVI